MILVYIVRMCDCEEFEEAVVCGRNEEDALSACGLSRGEKELIRVETIGQAVDSMERGIICWGVHSVKDAVQNLPVGALSCHEEEKEKN